jgi:REP element-mobilizing transposase RayT
VSRVKAASNQLEMTAIVRKRDKNGQFRGGRRPGAGRRPKGKRSSEPHKKRPALKASRPVHVTLRIAADISSLRTRHLYHAIRWAMIATFTHERFRIVHISIQREHMHMLVEADDAESLSAGMQGFEISAAKLINAAITERTGTKRRGQVFPDRYHAEIITCPTQARNALSYVMNNWRKHDEHRGKLARRWKLDPFSSAVNFPDWIERADDPWMWATRRTYERLPTWRPRTWLLWKGYLRGGPPISYAEIPGGKER